MLLLYDTQPISAGFYRIMRYYAQLSTASILILFAVFVIQFDEDSPMVNGDQVFISFISSAPEVSAMCSLTTQPSIDCE